jgi:glycosyltransferase involved in cell wall biosynthesis
LNKYLILISFSDLLGGAQIRYLNLFKEISARKADYQLIINRKLYEVAVQAGYLQKNDKRIKVLEIDKLNIKSNERSKIKNTLQNAKRNFKTLRKLRNVLISIMQLMFYTYKLNQLFKQNKPEYVYSIWVGGMIAWPLKYFYKFKLVYSYMDSGFSSLNKFWKHPLKCERLPIKYADTVDFLSESLYHGVKKVIKLKKKTKIAITPCSFKNYENLFPDYPKENTIVFCSRMTKIKNPLLLLESIRIINNEYPKCADISFQFIGNGECLDEMKEFIADNNLKNVVLLGNVFNPEKYFQKSIIFISIQQSNNYPSQSLIEAMACENAIIASDVGETRMLVTENEGVLVKLEANEIANALIYLLENNEKCTMLGFNAREKVLKEHNIENFLKHFYSLENL